MAEVSVEWSPSQAALDSIEILFNANQRPEAAFDVVRVGIHFESRMFQGLQTRPEFEHPLLRASRTEPGRRTSGKCATAAG